MSIFDTIIIHFPGCFVTHSHKSAIRSLSPGPSTWEDRPRFFYFGVVDEDEAACQKLCAAEVDCLAYASVNYAIGTDWGGKCYGRGPGMDDVMASQTHVMSGRKFQC